MTYLKVEKEGAVIIIDKDDIEAMQAKGWKVITQAPKKMKSENETVNEFKPAIGDKDNGHT